MGIDNIRHLFPNFVSGGRSTVCPKGHAIPDKAVTCPECAAENAEKGLQEQQVEFLRKAKNGDWQYTLRVSKTPERHAILYRTHTRTFCGQELRTRPHIDYAPYTTDTLSKLCPACRAAIASALQILDGQP
jgi:hypothetical protein